MKIEQIINETTTAGAVSSVAMPLGQTQRRTTENVKGLIPAEKVLKAKKKGPYANSLSEGKEKKPVIEADLQEDDLIIIPGQSKRLKAGFIPKAQDRTDHEVEMAKADLLALYKNTKSVLMCIKDISEDEGLEGWVQEKIIKASDYMNTLAEYFEGKKIQEMTGGVIAAGGVGEGVAEGLPGSSQIYDQIESLSDKLKHTSDPDKRRFYVKQIKKLEHKLHSTDDPFDIDDPAPIGKKGVAEGSIKDAEQALARHGQYKVDHEKKYGPMSGADLHQHEVMRKQLLDKKRRAQSAYAKKQGVAETKVDNYKDMGATSDTTHFIKNMTTGKIVSPHRSKQDAEDALVAHRRDSKDEFKIVRARKESVEEDLDANQKRVGQLGPTEKVGPKGAVGKLVGANESVEHDPLQDIKRLLGK